MLRHSSKQVSKCLPPDRANDNMYYFSIGTQASCPYDDSSDVLSTAATAGLVIGILLLVIIVVCGVLIWYYYKKRKEKERLDKLPLQKAQPANKKLVNGGMFKDVKIRQPSRNSKTPGTMAGTLTPVFTNGDVKVNIDTDPGIRRENSICISVQSRGAPGYGDLEPERKVGPAPVEEPEKLTKTSKDKDSTPRDKYMVDKSRSESFQSANKGLVKTTSGDHRRRFGDPPGDSARKNRRKTPRLRHPMEIQGETDQTADQIEGLQKAEGFWKEEKRQRSGRRREHPEALTIPSVKEDPFDYRDNTGTSAISQTRGNRSAVGLKMERENSAFIDPPKEQKAESEVWEKAANMWLYKNQPVWGNIAHH